LKEKRNNMNQSKLGGLLGTGGLVYGIAYSMKRNKSFGVTALYAIGFGIVGMMIGNQITKFYTD